jgi:hypothetical protein
VGDAGSQGWVPVEVVQERLGHANPSITMNIYAHALPGMQVHAAEQVWQPSSADTIPLHPPLQPGHEKSPVNRAFHCARGGLEPHACAARQGAGSCGRPREHRGAPPLSVGGTVDAPAVGAPGRIVASPAPCGRRRPCAGRLRSRPATASIWLMTATCADGDGRSALAVMRHPEGSVLLFDD